MEVQELKEICFFLLYLQRYSQIPKMSHCSATSRKFFSKLTIGHCFYTVPPSSFMNFSHQVALAMFVQFSFFPYFGHISWSSLVVDQRSTEIGH